MVAFGIFVLWSIATLALAVDDHRRTWSFGVRFALSTVFTYWVAVGAWRRTMWSFDQGHDHVVPSSGGLTTRQARRYIVVGALCVLSAGVALAVQLW
jgi:membrane protein YdbS with pleckstrin-like domain